MLEGCFWRESKEVVSLGKNRTARQRTAEEKTRNVSATSPALTKTSYTAPCLPDIGSSLGLTPKTVSVEKCQS